jgi:hypothetical protein
LESGRRWKLKNLQSINPFRVLVGEIQHYVSLNDERYGKLAELTSRENPILDVRRSKIQSYLKLKINSYWSTKVTVSVTRTDADGLYAAGDPFQSRSFGFLTKDPSDPDWALFRVELPRGMEFLDVALMEASGPGSINAENSPELFDAFSRLGCSKPGQFRYLFTKGNKYWGWEDSLGCREVALSILKELKVKALFYEWGNGTPFKGNRNDNSRAMILIDESLITEESTRGFTRALPDPIDESDLEERIILENLAKDVRVTINEETGLPVEIAGLFGRLFPIEYFLTWMNGRENTFLGVAWCLRSLFCESCIICRLIPLDIRGNSRRKDQFMKYSKVISISLMLLPAQGFASFWDDIDAVWLPPRSEKTHEATFEIKAPISIRPSQRRVLIFNGEIVTQPPVKASYCKLVVKEVSSEKRIQFAQRVSFGSVVKQVRYPADKPRYHSYVFSLHGSDLFDRLICFKPEGSKHSLMNLEIGELKNILHGVENMNPIFNLKVPHPSSKYEGYIAAEVPSEEDDSDLED